MILAPAFMRVVFQAEPDKSEFQGSLATPGNSVLTGHSISNSDEFSLLKSSGRGSVVFSAKYGFRKSHDCLGNFQYEGKMIGLKKKKRSPGSLYRGALKSSLGDSLKMSLLRESTRTYSGLFAPLSEFSMCYGSLELLKYRSLFDDFSKHSQEIHSVTLLRLIKSAVLHIDNG